MSLVGEIVKLLSDEESSLVQALLKTKVLLHRIGHKELTEWVNCELNGYADEYSIPVYRIVPSQVLVNAASMTHQFNSHPVPIGHLDPDLQKSYEEQKMGESVAVLQDFVEGKSNSSSLRRPIPMEANGLLGEGLAQGVHIQQAWCEVSLHTVTRILIEVRSRLLDF